MENYVLLNSDNMDVFTKGKIKSNPETFVNHPKVKKSWMFGGGTSGKMFYYMCFELENGHKETIRYEGDDDAIQKANEYLNTL